jgi:phosphatidate cytidylyltransferase
MSAQSPAPELGLLSSIVDALRDPDPLTLVIELTLAILITSSLVIELMARYRPSPLIPELRTRIRSWWIMAGLFVLAVAFHRNLSIAFFALLSYLALKEFYTLVHLRLADRRAILLAYLAVPVQYWWVYIGWADMFTVFIPVFMFLIIPFRLAVAGDTQRFMTSMGKLHWGLMAFVYGISHLAYLLVLPPLPYLEFAAGNQALLFYVVFLAEFNDVLQFVFGKTLGKRKLAPSISPNKTWEGLLGGWIGTAILAVLLRFLTPMDALHALGAGVLIGVLGPVGGLVISAIKRDVGVKDSGTLIPGHGGILDRVDSLCFSAPVFFHYIAFFYWP